MSKRTLAMIKYPTPRALRHQSTPRKQRAANCEESFVVADENCLNIRKSFEKYAASHGVTLIYSGDDGQALLNNHNRDMVRVFFDWISTSSVGNNDIGTVVVSTKIQHPDGHHQHQAGSRSRGSFMLTVEGDGMGIAPVKLKTLFYHFCHFEHKRINRAKLSSGLTFTKVVLNLKGADISIETRKPTPGGKVITRFHFVLPMEGETSANKDSYSVVWDKHDNDIFIENILLDDVDNGVDNSRNHTVNAADDQFLDKLMKLLEYHICDPDFNVAKLVSEIGMSRPVLFRKAKTLTGSSIINLIRSRRLRMAEMLLKQKKVDVSEVAFKVGYTDPKYFSKSFRSEFGKTPKEYVHALQH